MRFDPKPPWTRAHERLMRAWELLHQAHARRGFDGPRSLGDWCLAKFGVRVPRRLTVAQARQGRRCLNAWRAGMEGLRPFRRYPRQERRNAAQIAARRAVAAYTTAGALGTSYADAIRGKALECLGGLMPTESAR